MGVDIDLRILVCVLRERGLGLNAMDSPKITRRPKRSVLLLLGVYYSAHHNGIARYAHEAGWVLDNTYARGGMVPVWWQGDGMITLITSPRDYAALRLLPKLPLVDLSIGWVTNALLLAPGSSVW